DGKRGAHASGLRRREKATHQPSEDAEDEKNDRPYLPERVDSLTEARCLFHVRGEFGIELRAQHYDEHIANDGEETCAESAEEEVADGDLSKEAVNNEEDARRYEGADGARRGHTARGKPHVVAVAHQLRHRNTPHGRSTGN